MSGNLMWRCHVCKKERPDHLISVFKKPLIINGQKLGDQNIRYCNDNNVCREEVKKFSFMKSNKRE